MERWQWWWRAMDCMIQLGAIRRVRHQCWHPLQLCQAIQQSFEALAGHSSSWPAHDNLTVLGPDMAAVLRLVAASMWQCEEMAGLQLPAGSRH